MATPDVGEETAVRPSMVDEDWWRLRETIQRVSDEWVGDPSMVNHGRGLALVLEFMANREESRAFHERQG